MNRGDGNGTADLGAAGAFRGASGPAPGDRRGHNNPAKHPAPFSLRLSAEERAALEAQAGDTPLGAFIREKLLNGTAHPRQRRRRVGRDDEALARLLGELGKTRLANNLNQLAKAANAGALPVTPETLQAILEACKDVGTMRACLLAALGFRPEKDPDKGPQEEGKGGAP